MKDRVSVDQLNICEQIQHFAPCKLMAEEDVSKNSIQDWCDIFDGFDSTVVAIAYRSVHGLIDVADLQPEIAGGIANTILSKQ